MFDRTAHRRAAFTLVELLVVSGIVVLLAAILLSLLPRVQASARKAACANNLRQIGQGLITYAHEYQRLPGSDAHKAFSGLPSFRDVLTRRQGFPADTFACPVAEVGPSSYELNMNFVGRPLAAGRAGSILASERNVACVRCHDGGGAGSDAHGGRSNFLFFDGHVEALAAEEAGGPNSQNWDPSTD